MTETNDFLPFARPSIGREEIDAVVAALESGWITVGPRTKEFEQAFAAYVGVPHAVAVNSCTAGLELLLRALGVGPGAEVVLPSLTFAATANVVEHVGATPVFADVDPATWNLSPEAVAGAVTERTRAIIPVHYAGLACDMDALQAVADAHGGLPLIEDAAHAAGTRYAGRAAGSLGAAASFSFYANKNMTTGEGGMVTTRDPDVAKSVTRLRLHGMSKDAWKRYSEDGSWRYDIEEAGFKANMNDIAAAMGLVQLRRLESFNADRRALVERYRGQLGDLPGVELQADAPTGGTHAHHIFAVRLRGDAGAPPRDQVIRAFRDARVGFSVHFLPLHLTSHYRRRWGTAPGSLPTTEALGEELLSLPLFPGMTESEVDRVVEALRAGFGGAGRG